MYRPMTYALVPLFAVMLVAGCGSPTNEKTEKTEEDTPGLPELPPDTVEMNHSGHPTEGPHHGSLIELGQEEYHGELLHDEETGKVTIYLLDSSATKTVPVDAEEITVNVRHEGKPEQFKLEAQPDEDDPEGQSSRFVSQNKELGEHLHEKAADARLVVKIGGKSYNGKISHEHGHADNH